MVQSSYSYEHLKDTVDPTCCQGPGGPVLVTPLNRGYHIPVPLRNYRMGRVARPIHTPCPPGMLSPRPLLSDFNCCLRQSGRVGLPKGSLFYEPSSIAWGASGVKLPGSRFSIDRLQNPGYKISNAHRKRLMTLPCPCARLRRGRDFRRRGRVTPVGSVARNAVDFLGVGPRFGGKRPIPQEVQMRRILALTLLVLLAAGFASQLRADPLRWQCPRCQQYNTWSRHFCDECTEAFLVECWSEGGARPPDSAPCPQCSTMWAADWVECHSDICWTLGPFWP
jgi:hypothetical protein